VTSLRVRSVLPAPRATGRQAEAATPISAARRVAVNTASQALARAVSLALGAITIVVLTRHLGVGGFGVVVAATTYVSLFSVLVDLGTGTILVRALATSPQSAGTLVGKALGLRIALAVAASAVAAALLPAIYSGGADQRMRLAVLIVLPTIVFGSIASTLSAPLQAGLRMRRIAVVETAVQLTATASILALAHANRGLYEFLAVGVGAACLNAVLVAVACRGVGLAAPQIDVDAWRRLLVEALPLGIALVLNTIYFRIDALLLSVLRGPEDTGIYGAAFRFLEVSTGFTNLLVLSLFPLLAAAAHGHDVARVRELAQRGLDVLVLAGVPLVVATIAVAPSLVHLAAGEAFSASVSPLRIVIVAAALMPVNSLFGYLLIAMRHERDALWLNIVALVVNVALNLALIPRYGVLAAALIGTASEVVILVGVLVLVRRYADFVPAVRVSLRAIAAGVVMVPVMLAVGSQPAAAVALGAAAYVLALYLLRVHKLIPRPAS
jgi:O-antigen/teichoic acid export membrane protein